MINWLKNLFRRPNPIALYCPTCGAKEDRPTDNCSTCSKRSYENAYMRERTRLVDLRRQLPREKKVDFIVTMSNGKTRRVRGV